jgi:hypothetical protein
VSPTQICYPAGFKPGRLDELIYRAKDPLVLGLGFAATRDLGAFLKAAPKDDNGRDNPVFIKDAKAIMMGSSQSGRFVRTFIHLGFNRDEPRRTWPDRVRRGVSAHRWRPHASQPSIWTTGPRRRNGAG